MASYRRKSPHSPALIATITTAGCLQSIEDKIAARLHEDPTALEFGWELTEIRHVNGQYYAYLKMPPQFDASTYMPRRTERSVHNLRPAGEGLIGGEFWANEDRSHSLRLVVSTSHEKDRRMAAGLEAPVASCREGVEVMAHEYTKNLDLTGVFLAILLHDYRLVS